MNPSYSQALAIKYTICVCPQEAIAILRNGEICMMPKNYRIFQADHNVMTIFV